MCPYNFLCRLMAVNIKITMKTVKQEKKTYAPILFLD